jgi:hypothetical protein
MWHMTAETVRCKGRPGTNPRRCKTILWVGSWFYLHGKKPFCAACAVDPEQDVNAQQRHPADRRNVLDARNPANLDNL